MSVERWRVVEPLLDAALALSAERRADFLASACAGDDALRDDLAAMLAECDRDGTGLDRPAVERFATLMQDADDLAALQATTIVERYAIAREIGRGGTGTVYLARDLRHERAVAIKVLSADLGTGRAAARFLREIRVTAGLRHPHILPLFDSGTAGDRLYYVMPFVEGGTLRARLAREGALPIADARRVLRAVAAALAYAHRHGVVHRDVKPENVLLDDDGAVLGDFGIATAIARATGTEPGHATTALTGIALGTPTYVAPEQAAGDPSSDARVDLYSWGCMAYEVLSGAPPFAGRSAHAAIVAHLTEPPVPLGERRGDVPRVLAALVMQCLEKLPGARPASAEVLLETMDRDTLDARRDPRSETRPDALVTAPARVGSRRPTTRRVRVAGIGALATIGLVGVGWSLVPAESRATLQTLVTRPPPRLRIDRVVVAPLRDETGDPKLAALGSLVADYITDGLSQLGSLQVVDARTAATSGAVVRAIPRFLRPDDDRALGEETGAKVVVAGSYYLDGDSVRFRARVLDAATGEVRQAFPPVAALARSPSPGIAALSARIVATLRAASDSEGIVLGQHSPPPSLAAFAAVQEGWQAYVHQKPDSAVIGPLLRAAALDSTYGTPVAVLAYLASALGQYATSDSALVRAGPLREQLTLFEQSLLDVTEATARGDMAAALAAAHRGPSNEHLVAYHALLARRPGAAVRVLAAMDPDRGLNIAWAPYYWSRLAIGYAQRGDFDRALATVQGGERRSPALHAQGLDVAIAGARGDVGTVAAALAARWRAGERPASIAARATTLLRTRGGHEAQGRRLAAVWADRIYPPDTPVDTAGLSDPVPPEVELLVAAERWRDVLAVVTAAELRFARDSASGPRSPGWRTEQRQRLRMQRAITLIHLGRRAEALAIDAGFTRSVGTRWDRGVSAMARAVIAAHLGEPDRAIPLLAAAVESGALDVYLRRGATGLVSVDGDPLLLPLRADRRFRALGVPDPADHS